MSRLYRPDYVRAGDGWRVAHVAGFFDLNWYAWNLNDNQHRTCWDRGDSILRIAWWRLVMLHYHVRWSRIRRTLPERTVAR